MRRDGPTESATHQTRRPLRLQVFQLVAGLFQFFAELRVGHVNHGPRPLADRFAVEVGDAVLGDDVADVVGRGGNSTPKKSTVRSI